MHRIKEIWPKWEGVEILGEGGFGTVYKAKKDSFAGEEYCAIKIVQIPSNRAEADEMMDSGFTENNIKEYFYKSALNLVDEIKMMQKMKAASHVVSIEDYEVVENKNHLGYTIFIRMELLTNITKYFKTKEITVSEVVKMATDILTALEFCHSQNIMHRDIKPANIFISEFGEYKLGDFGISKEVEKTNATLSQKGTKSYMAPEMVRMEKYGKNVDLYALGLTMYELLNKGRMPFLPPYPQSFFPDDREKAMERRLRGDEFPEIEGIGDLNKIIHKACHPNKQQRYQSTSEMKKDLLALNTDNLTITQTSFENDKTYSEVTQSSLDDKTVGVFDLKPKNEFLFEDTITKPQPKPLPKVQSKVKVETKPVSKPQPTAKTETKVLVKPKVTAKPKKTIHFSGVADAFDKVLDGLDWKINGARKTIIGLILFVLWVCSWGLSLAPFVCVYIINTATFPSSVIGFHIAVSFLLLVVHQKLLKGKFLEGLWLFFMYPGLIAPVVGYVVFKDLTYVYIKYLQHLGATSVVSIAVYSVLFFVLPIITFSIINPIKNRFFD